jgi:hypothetical protein
VHRLATAERKPAKFSEPTHLWASLEGK